MDLSLGFKVRGWGLGFRVSGERSPESGVLGLGFGRGRVRVIGFRGVVLWDLIIRVL